MHFFNTLHSQLTDALPTGPDHTPQQHPSKEYPRMPRITLPRPSNLGGKLSDALGNAQLQHPLNDQALSLTQIGSLLGYSLGQKPNEVDLRMYGSYSGRFPLEGYLIAHGLVGVEPQIYHYHSATHTLEALWEPTEKCTAKDLCRDEAPAHASATLILTGFYPAFDESYGDSAYLYLLIELGQVLQSLAIIASGLQIGISVHTALHNNHITTLLDLVPADEVPLAVIALGGL
jgi:SagB-type dehydrogenase family enzyme